jgi:hypothetical protein
MQRATLKAWSDHRGDGDSVAMLAVTNETVHTLNRAAQVVRGTAGDLDRDHYVNASNSRVHVGDEIVTRRNDRTLHTDQGVMVRNRALWTVTDIDGDGSVTARNADGTVELPADYVAAFVELGYAQTVHAAQGATVDHCLLVVDGPIDGRALYVGMTRGADSNHVYVAVEANQVGRDVLDAALVADWTDVPAIEVRAEFAARIVTPFAPKPPEEAAAGLSADELRAVHAEHRALYALNLSGRAQQLQRLEREHLVDGRDLRAAHTQRDAITRRLATVTAQRAVLPAFGHKTERVQLDRDIKKLQQERVAVSRDIPRLEQRLEQRGPELAAQRQWAADYDGLAIRERELDHALSRDAGARGHVAARDTPTYLSRRLGPVPDDPNHRTAWERAAGTIEQYRTLHDITDPDRALGPQPDRSLEPDLAFEQQRIALQAHQVHELTIERDVGHRLGL